MKSLNMYPTCSQWAPYSKTSKGIKLLSKKVDDDIVSIKLKEVADQLQLIKKEPKVKDKHMISVLRAYDLVKEINNVIK